MATYGSDAGGDLTIQVVHPAALVPEQAAAMHHLQVQCFSDVPYAELIEDFVAASIAKVLAYEQQTLVGCASVHKRPIVYEEQAILLGGFGGVCTRSDRRGRGIGTRLCEQALDFLEKESCDVVFLAVGASKKTASFYERLGFVFLGRPFTFVNVRGEGKPPSSDDVGMLAPLCSPERFAHILHGSAWLHLGPEQGYW